MSFRALPSISVSAAGDSPDPEHAHSRMFIGPMPEKVVSQTEAHIKKKRRRLFHKSTEEGDDDISHIIKQNAFNFFIREGGRAEDWGEDEERSAVEEMVRRWKGSEWAAIWTHRRRKDTANRQTSRWVGGSFEVGRFLGVNILQGSESTRDALSSYRERPSMASHSARRVSFSGSHSTYATTHAPRSSMAQETFNTAPSQLTRSTSRVKADQGTSEIGGSSSTGESALDSSTRSLLRPALERLGPNGAKVRTEVMPRPIIKAPSLSALSDGAIPTSPDKKGKGRLVHYADIPPQEPSQELGPAPPSEVLERTGSAVEDTSAGASTTLDNSPSFGSDLNWGDVVMRGSRQFL